VVRVEVRGFKVRVRGLGIGLGRGFIRQLFLRRCRLRRTG
jgi:hypothetical protein